MLPYARPPVKCRGPAIPGYRGRPGRSARRRGPQPRGGTTGATRGRRRVRAPSWGQPSRGRHRRHPARAPLCRALRELAAMVRDPCRACSELGEGIRPVGRCALFRPDSSRRSQWPAAARADHPVILSAAKDPARKGHPAHAACPRVRAGCFTCYSAKQHTQPSQPKLPPPSHSSLRRAEEGRRSRLAAKHASFRNKVALPAGDEGPATQNERLHFFPDLSFSWI